MNMYFSIRLAVATMTIVWKNGIPLTFSKSEEAEFGQFGHMEVSQKEKISPKSC
jgi:hypothetical protein